MVKRVFSGAYFWCLFGVYFYKNRRKETNVRKAEISKNRMIPPFIALYKCVQKSFWRIQVPSLAPRRGDEIVVTQIVLVFIWASGLFRADFSKSPHRGCPTPKRAKNRFPNKNREAVFSFFRHRQRNDFRLSVRDVLEFDRGRRRWGSTCSRDGRKD